MLSLPSIASSPSFESVQCNMNAVKYLQPQRQASGSFPGQFAQVAAGVSPAKYSTATEAGLISALSDASNLLQQLQVPPLLSPDTPTSLVQSVRMLIVGAPLLHRACCSATNPGIWLHMCLS